MSPWDRADLWFLQMVSMVFGTMIGTGLEHGDLVLWLVPGVTWVVVVVVYIDTVRERNRS